MVTFCLKTNMAAGVKKKDENFDHILYNLLVHAEWNLDGEIVNRDSLDILQRPGSLGKKLLSILEGSVWGIWRFIKYPFSNFAVSCGLPEELLKLYESSQTWDFALSSDGKFVAILQEQCIEIRSARDNFSSVISKCQVHNDTSPKWRKLAWSSDTSLLAFAHSWGEVVVFDLSGTLLCSLKNNTSSNAYRSSGLFQHNKSISGLLFLDKDKRNESLLELLVISYQGQLNSYIINSHSGEHSTKRSFSFQSVLSHGVSSAVYYPVTKLLILGTPAACIAGPGKSALGNGITLWRLLSDQPYFKLMEDQALEIKKTQQATGFVGKLLPARSNNKQNGVWKMSLGLDGKTLLVLHLSGRLSLWELPSLKQRETWERTEQPQYKSEDVHVHFPSLNHSKRKVHQKDFIYDIGWWSNDAMVLARSTGALTVSALDKSLQNILGQYAEWCEPFPLVTCAHNGGFLILECENNVVSLSPVRKTMVDEGEQGTHEDDEEDEEHHVVTRTRELAKHLMYFLTESERFRPPVRRPRILKQTYRLLCLRSTTPEELYARKIELEEYGEALALAQSYDLDCDLVYQKQWRKSKVTVSSIHDYLSKVTKRIWVLHECLERVAEDLDSTKALLKYGLHGTGLPVLVAMGDTEHPFLREENEENEVEDEREDEVKLLKNIDFDKLSVEQRNVCRYRLRFLKYWDRLSTYETILGGPAVAHDAFDSDFFTKFRDSNIVETSVDFARDNDWNAVDCLLTYHGRETLPHYLSILSNFPETTKPFDYRSLLPEAGIEENEPEVYDWEQKTWRTQDWVENRQYSKTFECEADEDPGEFLYHENGELRTFSGILNSKMLTEWYKYRAHEIEQCSGQIDNALQLVKLAKERGVKGLAFLHDDLLTLSVLVYECQGDCIVDLQSFQDLNNLEKMKLLLSKSTEQSFIEDFRKWVVPFLDRVEKRNRGSKTKLIQQYMTDTAKTDLTFSLKILQQSSSESTEPFICDVARQMKLAIDCIYLCSREDQLEEAGLILKCFTSEGVLSQQIGELRKKLDELELYLNGAKILSENGFAKPVSYLVDTKADKEAVAFLMVSLSQIAKNREPPLKRADWDKLLADMLKLRDEIFDCISASVCYKACAECLLGSGNIENIKHSVHLLSCRADGSDSGGRVDHQRSVDLVVKSAREYFNSANDVKDPCMNLAKACLDLVARTEPAVKEELDFITALSMLTEYNVSILPLQVRLCQDKAELIEKTLNSSPTSYKDPGKLLRLASLLQLSGSDENTRRGRVLSLVAQRALDHADFTVAYNACAQLVKTGYISGWKICRSLGENTEFTNLNARQKLLNFSIAHCDPNAIEALLHSRSLLQTEILYFELSELMEKIGDPLDSDDLTTTGQISETTKTILSSVSDVGWWKDTLQWVRPLHKPTNQNEEHTTGVPQKELEFHCHPFYESAQERSVEKIEKSNSDKTDGIRISELLLQTQKLAEERAEGSIEEPGTEVLIQLADNSFLEDTPLGLAYLLSLPESTNAYECFEKLPNCTLTLQLASYYYALQVYNLLCPQVQDTQASLYLHPPEHLVEHVIMSLRGRVETGDGAKFLVAHLMRYHTQLADFAQARLLQGLGRGVDISRFTQDEEYKRETILGLTMSVDDRIFETAVSLAERYDISKWEMFMSHLEWLFTDSELSTKQLQDRVDEKGLMNTLLERPEKVVSRLQEYIYPAIDGKQLARLLYYYMLINDCVQNGGLTYEDDSDPQTHIRLIKKIKASSQGVNYKKLMDGGDPLESLRSFLLSTNVHVFAKMANRLRDKNGEPLNSSQVFKVFAKKIFWEGERKTIEKEIDWIHRYEDVHGYLDRLTLHDLIDLIDSLTFSEKSIAMLTVDVRDEILRRVLKFSRQRSAAGGQRKKSKENIYESSAGIAEATKHFEQSLKHLTSLDNAIVLKLEDSEQVQHMKYARLYDLSRSEPEKIKELCVQVLCHGDALEIVNDFLDLATQHCVHGLKSKDIVKESLRTVLKTCSDPEKRPLYLGLETTSLDFLTKLLTSLHQHVTSDTVSKKFIKEEDILQEIRTFCADEAVSPDVKHEVLQLIEKTVKLTGEDKILLLFHQTRAIVHKHWGIELSIADMKSSENLAQLFKQAIDKTETKNQLLALASLLSIWPSFETAHDAEGAWYLVLSKLINDAKDGSSVLTIVREKVDSIQLNKKDCQRILDALLQKCEQLLALKFGLLVGDEEMFEFIVNEMKVLQPDQAIWDNEFFELIFKNKLSWKIAETPLFTAYVNYLLTGEAVEHTRESRVNQVVRELHEAGYTVQAASINASLDNMHPGFRTLDNVLWTFLRLIRNS